MRVNQVVAVLGLAAMVLGGVSCRKRQACTLRIDDKNVDVVSALAMTDGSALVRVLVSPARIGCDALRDAHRAPVPHEVWLDVAPELLVAEWTEPTHRGFRYRPAAADALLVWSVGWNKADGHDASPLVHTLGGEAPPYDLKSKDTLASGGTIRGHMDLRDAGAASHLSFDGDLTITGCGDRPNPLPVLAKAKLLGREVPIRGVTQKTDSLGSPMLEVSSIGGGCAPTGMPDLGVLFFFTGSPPHLFRVSVNGSFVSGEQLEDPALFTIGLGNPTKIDGTGSLFELHATLPVTTCPSL